MPSFHEINNDRIDLEIITQIVEQDIKLKLSDAAIARIEKCRTYLDEKVGQSDELIYGVNTGFGSLCDVAITKDQIEELQYNLVVSHACGTGEEVPREVAKLMLFLKVQSLSYGHSGAQLETCERLLEMYNKDIIPVVYQLGSLGASGDLSPLAHLSLPLLGLGEVYYQGQKQPSALVMDQIGRQPLRLKSKEGLALLNGTQFMTAYGVYMLIEARRMAKLADLTAAMSLDAFACRIDPFNEHIHRVRPHKGQIDTAAAIRDLLADSAIQAEEKPQVQDPYSFRCVPQVHGASKGVFQQVTDTFMTEINSVTDNPNVFVDEDIIVSGGNFHGQPLALALDYMGLGLAELGNISERRTYFLLSGYRDLPPFLVKNPGLNSGLMIPQYTAASMVSQNKQLATPASVDSIDSSNRQEDHVSMGANAATKSFRILQNLERILAIEFLTAAQGIACRRPMKSSTQIESILSEYRKVVPVIENDRPFYIDMANTVDFMKRVS